jgi:hypothetical protein
VVENSGKTLHADAFRPVNLPETVRVEEDDTGLPKTVRLPRRQAIIAIEDRWRLDDEWWRQEPVSRLYYTIRLASGQKLVIYKDLVTGAWYRQSY